MFATQDGCTSSYVSVSICFQYQLLVCAKGEVLLHPCHACGRPRVCVNQMLDEIGPTFPPVGSRQCILGTSVLFYLCDSPEGQVRLRDFEWPKVHFMA